MEVISLRHAKNVRRATGRHGATVSARADVNAQETGGRTALMVAAMNGNSLIVDALLGEGADPNIVAWKVTHSRGESPRFVPIDDENATMLPPRGEL